VKIKKELNKKNILNYGDDDIFYKKGKATLCLITFSF